VNANRKKLLSVREVAAWFGVNPITIYRKVRMGEMPAMKFGKNWLFSEDALNTWIANKSTTKKSEKSHRFDSLKNLKPLLLVYQFGSTVSGYETPLSDVDIAYLDDGSVSPFDFEVELESFLRGIFPSALRIDLIRLNTAPATVRYKVINTGKLIYARSDDVRAKFEEDTVQNYLDYESVLSKFFHEAA